MQEQSGIVAACAAIRLRLEQATMALSMGLLLSLAVIVTIAVIFRKAGHSLVWYDELASILLAWLSFYGSVVASCRCKHLIFSGLLSKLPLHIGYTGLALQRAVSIGFFIVMAVAAWQVMDLMAGEELITIPLSRSFAQSALPVSCVLMCIAELVTVPEAVHNLRIRMDAEKREISEAIAATRENGEA